MRRRIEGVEALRRAVGTELGVSDWKPVEQSLITDFADTTGDRQWIHIDAARASSGPFGGTVAHGLLTLSLIPSMSEAVFVVEGVHGRVHLGYDRVRFVAPVRAGSRIRDRIVLTGLRDVPRGVRMHLTHTVEVEGDDHPACSAETITLLLTASSDGAVRAGHPVPKPERAR